MLHDTAVSSYDPDSDFSELNKGALSRLEAAGIPVVTSLEKLVKEKLPDMIITTDCNILEEFACSVISSASSFEPPTWKLLYEVLKELDPKGLSQDIEEYLSCELMSYMIYACNNVYSLLKYCRLV